MNPSTTARSLDGRVILVTGATGGIGRAVALACARAGATVVLHGRNPQRLEALYDEVAGAGGPEPAALPLDLASAGARQFDALAADVDQACGRLDGIAHCAAHVPRLAAVDGLPPDEWTTTLRVNVVAALGITRASLPLLRASGSAAVIYTLESHHGGGDAYLAALAVPGAALAQALRIQATEWSAFAGLRCHGLVPGPVDSPSRRRTHPGEPRSSLPPADSVAGAYVRLLDPGCGVASGGILDAAALS